MTSKTSKGVMKARFFTAPHIDHQSGRQTWKKTYVLTEDGTLYCEYMEYMRDSIIKEQVDFNTFEAKDFSYGNYQRLTEVTKEQALAHKLTRQLPWVQLYLNSKGIY